MHKHLHEVFGWEGPMTHRQFQSWQHWLNEQWDQPSRSDAYLMQIACEVRRGNAKHPGRVQLKHFVLQFTPPKPAPSTPESIAASKSVWLGRMGMKAEIKDNWGEKVGGG